MTIELHTESILNKQFKDAEKKKDKSFHWGNIGWEIESAVQQSALIMNWKKDENIDEYFIRVLPEIEGLVGYYRSDNIDADGYALGTVIEIQKDLMNIADRCKAGSSGE